MRLRNALIVVSIGVIGYQIWLMARRRDDNRGYCLGGVWIPPGAGKPFIEDGKMYYRDKGGLVEVDIEKTDKRCL